MEGGRLTSLAAVVGTRRLGKSDLKIMAFA
jgi:hypothetical protein